MQRKAFLPAILTIVSLLLAACGGGSQPAASTSAPAAATSAGGAAAEATTAPAAGAEATTAPTTAAAGGEATTAATTAATSAAGAEATTAPTTAAAGGAATSEATAAAPDVGDAPDVQGLKKFDGVTITAIQSANENVGPAIDRKVADKFEQLTGAKVNLVLGETSATDRLAIYRQQLSAGSSDVDVYMVDVIWPGIVAEYAEDLKPTMGELADFFPAIVQNNTVDGKLVAVPYYTDAGLMYYRKDLLQKYNLQPPATWADLEKAAKTIQDGERASNPDFWGFVWQGKAYEGLTCDALEWQASNGGGSIVEPDGTVSVNNPQAIAAFERAKGWVGTISPPGVTTYQEEESRGVWQAGNAAFMRNWPYAYALGQAADSAIKDKFDVMPIPKGDGPNARNADTLGGWQLMVNKNSKNKEAAMEYVKYVTSAEVQKFNSIQRGLLPTRPALYEDADILAKYPFYGPLQSVFVDGAVARPSTVSADLYNDVSTAYFTAVNQILTGQQEAGPAVEELQGKIESILR